MATNKQNQPVLKRGRPSKYTPEIANEIVERLSNGEPLAQICRDERMPGYRTVYDWADVRPDFSANIARARLDGFDAIAADCLMIANTPIKGIETTTKDDGRVETKVSDMLGHRKLQIDTRLKLLAKWDPKRFGERLELDGGLTIKKDASEYTDAELLAIATRGKTLA